MRAYGFIHTHSEYSLKDSPLSLIDMIKGAKEMGATAIALTDHGTAAGWIEFYDLCEKEGIKPILGVEAYVRSETSSRAHLILLAKNYEGYQEISQAISDSYQNIEKVADMDIPIMTKEIIKNYLHGENVIVTSACISGVLSDILLSQRKIQKEIDVIKEKMEDYYSPYDTGYLKNKELVASLDKEIAILISEREEQQVIAKRTFRKQKNSLKIYKKEDPALYEEQKKQLEIAEQETKEAKKKVTEIKKQLQNKRRRRTLVNGRCSEAEKKQQKYIEAEAKIKKLTEKLTTEEEAIEKIKDEVKWYTSFLGESFYIEVQNHGMDEEAYVMPILVKIANEMQVPLVASNDIHILRKEDTDIRQFIRSLRFKKYEEIGPADKELYMKDDEELQSALSEILPQDVVSQAMEGIKNICDSCNLVIPDTKHYPRYRDENGNIVEDSATLLRQKTLEGIPKRYPNGMDAGRVKKMEYELSIIIKMGFADYLLIVADYVNYAKNYSKKIGKVSGRKVSIGYGVGPGRGSGAGCIVNYLLGITDVDPVTYGLLFQRFLNPERVTMPDIDVDFSEEVREPTINYCRKKYGVTSVAGIRTVVTQQGRMVVRNAARFLGWKYPEQKEKYQVLGGLIASATDSSVKKEITELQKEFSDPMSKNILSIATRAEGIANSFGVHAAGVIIGDGQPLKEIIPLLYNTKKNQWAIQCDMNKGERMGCLKMDFLGLKNLDIMTKSIRLIYDRKGIALDLSNLPFEDAVFKEIFAKGKTGCVFQFESGGMKQMLVQFEPECFEDIILLVASYRPGPMQYIPDMIDIKHKRKKAEYIIPQLEGILEKTYGQCIYQEQLMDIFHKCAGFSLGKADLIRRYMSKKKEDLFLKEKEPFVNGIIKNGALRDDAEKYWNEMVDFAKYAFNKSHAATYALISYQTAYLKYHYPMEYMCGVLMCAKIEKLPIYMYECKQCDVQVAAPDINLSEEDFSIKNNKIFFGLSKIKGVGKAGKAIIEERKKGQFISFADFLLRVNIDIGKIKALIQTGCFDKLENDKRSYLLSVSENMNKLARSIAKKTAELTLLGEEHKKKAENLKKTIDSLRSEYDKIVKHGKDIVLKDRLEFLKEEKELLGAYVSGHPLDKYKKLFNRKYITLINDVGKGKYSCIGCIQNLRYAKRKSDGAKMAFFTLEDLSGSIEVNCFVKEFAQFKDLIAEDAVVEIYGYVQEERDFSDEEETIFKLTAKKIKKCSETDGYILLSTACQRSYKIYTLPFIEDYLCEDGKSVLLHNEQTGRVGLSSLKLNKEILSVFDSLSLEEKPKDTWVQLVNI